MASETLAVVEERWKQEDARLQALRGTMPESEYIRRREEVLGPIERQRSELYKQKAQEQEAANRERIIQMRSRTPGHYPEGIYATERGAIEAKEKEIVMGGVDMRSRIPATVGGYGDASLMVGGRWAGEASVGVHGTERQEQRLYPQAKAGPSEEERRYEFKQQALYSELGRRYVPTSFGFRYITTFEAYGTDKGMAFQYQYNPNIPAHTQAEIQGGIKKKLPKGYSIRNEGGMFYIMPDLGIDNITRISATGKGLEIEYEAPVAARGGDIMAAAPEPLPKLEDKKADIMMGPQGTPIITNYEDLVRAPKGYMVTDAQGMPRFMEGSMFPEAPVEERPLYGKETVLLDWTFLDKATDLEKMQKRAWVKEYYIPPGFQAVNPETTYGKGLYEHLGVTPSEKTVVLNPTSDYLAAKFQKPEPVNQNVLKMEYFETLPSAFGYGYAKAQAYIDRGIEQSQFIRGWKGAFREGEEKVLVPLKATVATLGEKAGLKKPEAGYVADFAMTYPSGVAEFMKIAPEFGLKAGSRVGMLGSLLQSGEKGTRRQAEEIGITWLSHGVVLGLGMGQVWETVQKNPEKAPLYAMRIHSYMAVPSMYGATLGPLAKKGLLGLSKRAFPNDAAVISRYMEAGKPVSTADITPSMSRAAARAESLKMQQAEKAALTSRWDALYKQNQIKPFKPTLGERIEEAAYMAVMKTRMKLGLTAFGKVEYVGLKQNMPGLQALAARDARLAAMQPPQSFSSMLKGSISKALKGSRKGAMAPPYGIYTMLKIKMPTATVGKVSPYVGLLGTAALPMSSPRTGYKPEQSNIQSVKLKQIERTMQQELSREKTAQMKKQQTLFGLKLKTATMQRPMKRQDTQQRQNLVAPAVMVAARELPRTKPSQIQKVIIGVKPPTRPPPRNPPPMAVFFPGLNEPKGMKKAKKKPKKGMPARFTPSLLGMASGVRQSPPTGRISGFEPRGMPTMPRKRKK